MKTSQVYNSVLKILSLVSIAFCILIMIPNIIKFIWEWESSSSSPSHIQAMVLITLAIITVSCLLYRYSKFLSEKFDRLNKLAIFSSISILSTIIFPYTRRYDEIIAYIMIPSVIITALIIPFKLTSWSVIKFKDSYLLGIATFFFGLLSFFIFALFVSIASRGVVGEGAVGTGLIILIGGVVAAMISTIINVVYVLFR